jgi:hypothetical protein
MCPAYGLAEATLAVTMHRPGDAVRSTTLADDEALLHDVIGLDPKRRVVCVGKPVGQMEVQTRGGTIGEIHVRGMAALVTFGTVGVLHDALRNVQHARHAGARSISMDATLMFLGFALIVLGWASVKRLLSFAPISRWAPSRLGRALSWLAFAPWLAAMYWLAEWVLAGRGFPSVFSDS